MAKDPNRPSYDPSAVERMLAQSIAPPPTAEEIAAHTADDFSIPKAAKKPASALIDMSWVTDEDAAWAKGMQQDSKNDANSIIAAVHLRNKKPIPPTGDGYLGQRMHILKRKLDDLKKSDPKKYVGLAIQYGFPPAESAEKPTAGPAGDTTGDTAELPELEPMDDDAPAFPELSRTRIGPREPDRAEGQKAGRRATQ